MGREFVPFDFDEIGKEFNLLDASSLRDAAKLDFCMKRIEQTSPKENPSPALVWTFADGLKELRHENANYKGRLLFYIPELPSGSQELVILHVFRKESQKTPRTAIKKALDRMKLDIAKRRELNS